MPSRPLPLLAPEIHITANSQGVRPQRHDDHTRHPAGIGAESSPFFWTCFRSEGNPGFREMSATHPPLRHRLETSDREACTLRANRRARLPRPALRGDFSVGSAPHVIPTTSSARSAPAPGAVPASSHAHAGPSLLRANPRIRSVPDTRRRQPYFTNAAEHPTCSCDALPEVGRWLPIAPKRPRPTARLQPYCGPG